MNIGTLLAMTAGLAGLGSQDHITQAMGYKPNGATPRPKRTLPPVLGLPVDARLVLQQKTGLPYRQVKAFCRSRVTKHGKAARRLIIETLTKGAPS